MPDFTWHHLHTLEGHTDTVESIALSPDGHTLLSRAWDRTLKLWDWQSGQLLRTLPMHRTAVNCFALSADGKLVAVDRKRDVIEIINIQTGESVCTFEHLFMGYGTGDGLNCAAFTPDGRWLYTASSGGNVYMWDLHVPDGQPEFRVCINGSGYAMSDFVISPDGQFMVGYYDSWIKLLELSTEAVGSGHARYRRDTGDEIISSLSLSPDGQRLAISHYDGTLGLWQVHGAKQLATWRGHDADVNSLSFSPDGTILASGGDDATVKLWDVNSTQELCSLTGHGEAIKTLLFTADGHTLLSGSRDQSIRVWQAQS
jgi:WD40 repeat protein